MKSSRLIGTVVLLLICWRADAFYNPAMGRWINRDPIGEQGFEALSAKPNKRAGSPDGHLQVFVANNPTSRIDSLGLSDADVSKIVGEFIATMKDMCKTKRHCDCYGIGILQDFNASFTSAWGCAAQADYMEGAIIALILKFDDEWTTEHRRYQYPIWPLMHQDVVVRHKDPPSEDDPLAVDSIVLDPFYGCYSIVPAHFTEGDPMWGHYPRHQCFTCKSLLGN